MKKWFVPGILVGLASFAVGCAQTPSTADKRPAAKTQRKLYVSRTLPTGSHIPVASSYDADAAPSNVQTADADQISRQSDLSSARLGNSGGFGGGGR